MEPTNVSVGQQIRVAYRSPTPYKGIRGQVVSKGDDYLIVFSKKSGTDVRVPFDNIEAIEVLAPGSPVRDLVEFRVLVTPTLLVLAWVVGAAVFTFVGVLAIADGSVDTLTGIVGLVVGNLLWRVWIEVVIVLFRIYDVLRSIDRRGGARL